MIKLNEFIDNPDKEFFIQTEIADLFGNQTINFAVDIVHINGIKRPTFTQTYYKQDASEESQPDFKMPKEMLF